MQLLDFCHVRFVLYRKMNSYSLMLCVNVLGNLLYFGLRKIPSKWTFRVDHESFKNVRTGTDTPHGGSDWADKLVFSSLCC